MIFFIGLWLILWDVFYPFFQGLEKFRDFGFPVVGPVSFIYIQIREHRVTCILVCFLFGEALVTWKTKEHMPLRKKLVLYKRLGTETWYWRSKSFQCLFPVLQTPHKNRWLYCFLKIACSCFLKTKSWKIIRQLY